VEAQRQADATPIPKLSERAQAAVATLATATDEKAQVALWRGMTSDKTIGAELRQFSAAVAAAVRRRHHTRHAAQRRRAG
jgi:hypothetical protein